MLAKGSLKLLNEHEEKKKKKNQNKQRKIKTDNS